MRKSNLERLRDEKRKKQPTTETDLRGLFTLLLGGEPNPTQWDFICDPTRLKAYKGPAGCAKTSTICAAGMGRSLLQPGSKGLVARHDYNDLLGTTGLRMEEMLNRLPKGVLLDRDKSPPMKWWIKPAIPDADPSMVTFMGLKEALGSYEFNWAILDEADEMEENRVHEVNTRLRNAGGDYMVALAFNPPDKHHWLYSACTGRDFQERRIKDPWLKLYEPQARENIAHLPDGYYENLARSLPSDMRTRLIEGEWGSSFSGQPVYPQFSASLHVRDLSFNAALPLYRFWDFGYSRPACIWAQVDPEGRLLVLREFLGENMVVAALARQVLHITATEFQGAQDITDYGDPAVTQKKDTGQALGELFQLGITIRYKSALIITGLRQLRTKLELLINREAAIQFDRKRCSVIIAGLKGGYRMDKHGLKPVKDGFYDHLMDALRYGHDNVFFGGGDTGAIEQARALPQSVEYSPGMDPGYGDFS